MNAKVEITFWLDEHSTRGIEGISWTTFYEPQVVRRSMEKSAVRSHHCFTANKLEP